MKFSVADRKTLPDGTTRVMLDVPKEELIYIGYILESFEGLCNYTTPNKSEPFLQVDVTNDYLNDFNKLIKALSDWNYEEV
ncbi:MAG: DUF4911 domain-containing protein [Candidatus Cloacimonetes bacterium]|nr:DUF4911 domain-containing protein [Candidatus Cloacimonadota bacterium]MBT4574922.1 DUF4911 domain-containing protein [Candidatus Cloacimonadota bacterium]